MPRYDAENLPTGEWGEFRKIAITKAVRVDHDFEVETLEGTMKAKAGDFLCLDSNGNAYPCDYGVFISSYAPVEWEEKAA